MSSLRLNAGIWWSLSILAGIGLAAVAAFTPPISPPKTGDHTGPSISNPLGPAYLGDAACAQCHRQQAELHQTSGHAHTLQSDGLCGRFAALLDREFPDPEREGVFRFRCDSDSLVAECLHEGKLLRMPIQFAVGSGTHAVTFLTLIEGLEGEPTGIEHRLSVFAKEMGLTPGHGGVPMEREVDCLGRVKRGRDVVGCIECHSTTSQIRGTLVADLRANVGCERCHGPGRQHVAAVEQGLADLAVEFSPRTATAKDEVQLCGQCHRLPEALKTLPDPDDKKLARFQPIGIQQSACFQRSDGNLRCSTCHNPHESVQRGASTYNSQCQKCHSSAGEPHPACSISQQGDCVHCHMPAVEVHPGISFRDHWIRRPEARVP
jgi:hypothetical protein